MHLAIKMPALAKTRDLLYFLLKFVVLGCMLLGLPLAGVYLAGYPVRRYLEFPPLTRYVDHAPFSWSTFAVFVIIILAAVIPLAFTGNQGHKKRQPKTAGTISNPFPWWGWIGV